MDSIYDFSNKLLQMGNKDWLLSNSPFCFGRRMSGRTHNVILRGILNGFNSGKSDYNIAFVLHSRTQIKSIKDAIIRISHSIDVWDISRDNNNEIQLNFNDLFVTISFIVTDIQIRGRDNDLVIIDNVNYIKNMNNYFIGLMVQDDPSYIIAGDSFDTL